jgi:hypothetical protein
MIPLLLLLLPHSVPIKIKGLPRNVIRVIPNI